MHDCCNVPQRASSGDQKTQQGGDMNAVYESWFRVDNVVPLGKYCVDQEDDRVGKKPTNVFDVNNKCSAGGISMQRFFVLLICF